MYGSGQYFSMGERKYEPRNWSCSRTVMMEGIDHWHQASSFGYHKALTSTGGDHTVLGGLFQDERDLRGRVVSGILRLLRLLLTGGWSRSVSEITAITRVR